MSGMFKSLHGFMPGIRLAAKPLPEPEPIDAVGRPISGFIAHLTPEQRARALAYKGPENFGDERFKKNKPA